MKNVNDYDVHDIVYNAVNACCDELDNMFPGYENGGITSNFAGQLETFIKSKLVEMNLVRAED